MAKSENRVSLINVISVKRNEEQRELQELNDTFAMYLQRVKTLETKNQQLQLKINALRNSWGSDSSIVRDNYEKELVGCRKQLDNIARDMQLAQVKAIRGQLDKASLGNQISFVHRLIVSEQQSNALTEQEHERSKIELESYRNEFKNKMAEIERSKSEMKRQLDYIQSLNKEYDNELMSRITLEIELQTLREELLFLKAIFEEENNELSALGTFQLDIHQFYRDELTRAIINIKKDFEVLSRTQYQEWEEYYKQKITHIENDFTESKRKLRENPNDAVKIDFKTLQATLEELLAAIKVAQTENLKLTTALQAFEEEYGNIKFRNGQKLSIYEQQHTALLAECNALQSAIDDIRENNVPLQFEIKTYRRLLEGVYTAEVIKTHDVKMFWSNSTTAEFLAADVRAFTVLKWADNVQITGSNIKLDVKFNGPNGWSGVSFTAIYNISREHVVIEADVVDQFNFSNYGEYQLSIYYPNSNNCIGTWKIHIEPVSSICMPKQIIVRDSINNLLSDTTVQISLNGRVVFSGTTNANGVVSIPQNLPSNSYDIEINTQKAQYKIARFQRIVFPSRGVDSITYFVYRQMQPDEVEFLLTWGKRPSDLDSHIYVSDGRHVYFSCKQERNVSLDYDCRDGGGPETIKVKLEPNMKYVYAVHRYTKDGELARSEASVTISTNETVGVGHPFKIVRVPYVNQPDANFWIVCQIDGTTKKITYFNHEFENRDECNTDSFIRRFYNQ